MILFMDIKSLEAKKATIGNAFESMKAEQTSYSTKVQELETELIKLQGEYRLVEELISQLTEKDSKNAK